MSSKGRSVFERPFFANHSLKALRREPSTSVFERPFFANHSRVEALLFL